MFRKALYVIVIILVFIVIFDAIFHSRWSKAEVVLGGKVFIVDIANTPTLREQGLSGRKSLALDNGMFFIFDKSDKYGFWMNDMNFPIDIIWISSDMHIVHIEKSLATSTYPKIYYPETEAQFVLEISSGQSDVLKLKNGDEVNFMQNLSK